MRFDITSLGDHLPDPVSRAYSQTQAQRFGTIVECGVRGEALGYGAIWIGEHHASDYIVSSPQMLLAAIASNTDKIRLGSAVSLLPNADPVRLAEDFATLDLLSNGRAEIGFGSGITEHTFQLFGQKVENADALASENLDLVQTLWRDDVVNWSGKFRAPILDTKLEPRTFNGRPIPISRATGSSIATAIAAGKAGHKLALLNIISGFGNARIVAEAYRKAYRESGHDLANMKVSGAAFVYVRENGADLMDRFGPYLANYQNFTRSLLASKGMSRGIGQLFQSVTEKTPAAPGEALLVGEPSAIVEKIEQNFELMGGFDELKLLFDVGGLAADDVLKSIEVFAEKVAPRVRAKSDSETHKAAVQ
jgi:alkanesulfonate monooxygenase SsuD/methylene tetrahydromethanopterin reductase-like flavin-dependent oxidoreductase (luciferase family)